jgi:two-component system, OmpR family, response regulator MtrA
MLNHSQSPTTILAVDNDVEVLATICRVLEHEGYKVITAKEGTTALALAHQHRPDLIILDVVMPGMDGVEVCRQLRAMPFAERIPILFLSVHQNAEEIARALDSGGDDYLRKPFVPRELAARLRALLRRSVRKQNQMAPTLWLDSQNHSVMVNGARIVLTVTEYGLLDYLCRYPQAHHTAGSLLQALWGYPPGAGDAALVRNHIRNLRRKIEDDPDHPSMVLSLHGRGYAVHAQVLYVDADEKVCSGSPLPPR